MKKLNRRQFLPGFLGAVAALVMAPFTKLAQAAGVWKEHRHSTLGGMSCGNGWAIHYSQRLLRSGENYMGDWPVVTLTHNGFLWAMFSTDKVEGVKLYEALSGKNLDQQELADLIAKVMVWDKDQLLNYWRPGYVRYLRHMYKTDPLAQKILLAVAEHDADFEICTDPNYFQFQVRNMIRRRHPDPAEATLGRFAACLA